MGLPLFQILNVIFRSLNIAHDNIFKPVQLIAILLRIQGRAYALYTFVQPVKVHIDSLQKLKSTHFGIMPSLIPALPLTDPVSFLISPAPSPPNWCPLSVGL